MKKEILFVDPKKILNNMIIKEFKNRGYNLTSSFSVFDAEKIVKEGNFDLVIVDSYNLKLDSISSLEILRKKYDGLVVLIKDKFNKEDLVKCKRLGVNEIINTPFDSGDALIKIDKLFNENKEVKEKDIINKEFYLDITNSRLYINSKEIVTTKTDFNILRYLYKNLDNLSLKDNLFAFFNEKDDKRIVDQYIKRIRKLLIDTKYEIKTVYGLGYIMKTKK